MAHVTSVTVLRDKGPAQDPAHCWKEAAGQQKAMVPGSQAFLLQGAWAVCF